MKGISHTIGSLVQTACTWEVLARKAGNVCPGREYPDLTVRDFLQSAAAIAPVLEQAPFRPIGRTILDAICATRTVATTNTNLGIVLLLVPLASVPLDKPLLPALATRLRQLTVEDSCLVYEAIRLAQPSGLGEMSAEDVRAAPTLPLRDVMALGRDRDLIAAQYVDDFRLVLEEGVPTLVSGIQQHGNIERGIVAAQLMLLARHVDSHICRKRGHAEAEKVQTFAQQLLALDMQTEAGRQAYRVFDAWLRADNHARNPGTTADLLAACLFVALRQGAIPAEMPFAWKGHPFQGILPP